jgi:hypothetical protein
MKVDRSMQHAAMRPQAVPAGGAMKAGDAMEAVDATKTSRPEPSWAASGIIALALFFAGGAPGVAMASGHGHDGHTRPHHPAAASHHGGKSSPKHPRHVSERPWMY